MPDGRWNRNKRGQDHGLKHHDLAFFYSDSCHTHLVQRRDDFLACPAGKAEVDELIRYSPDWKTTVWSYEAPMSLIASASVT